MKLLNLVDKAVVCQVLSFKNDLKFPDRLKDDVAREIKTVSKRTAMKVPGKLRSVNLSQVIDEMTKLL